MSKAKNIAPAHAKAQADGQDMEAFLLKIARTAFYGMIFLILFAFGPLPYYSCLYGYDPEVDGTLLITGEHTCLKMFRDISLEEWYERADRRKEPKMIKERRAFEDEGTKLYAMYEAVLERDRELGTWSSAEEVDFFEDMIRQYEERFQMRYTQ